MTQCWLMLAFGVAAASAAIHDNTIAGSERGISSGDELVSSVIGECVGGEGPFMRCVREKVLSFLEGPAFGGEKRSLKEAEQDSGQEADLDGRITARIQRYLVKHRFELQLPYSDAKLTLTPAAGIDSLQLELPLPPTDEARAQTKERDMMQEKMLMPLLMMLKMKIKMLTPILLAVVGLKAMKALILSKIAILLVVGFLVMQLCKKGGMMMPMGMSMNAVEASPPMPYGLPSTGPMSTPSSYEPSWEPSSASAGPYARIWDAQPIAYSSYHSSQAASSQQSRN